MTVSKMSFREKPGAMTKSFKKPVVGFFSYLQALQMSCPVQIFLRPNGLEIP